MRIYETTFIINPQSDDSAIDQQVNDIKNIITGSGGNIVRENRIGTRRLAYPIQNLAQGYYTNFIFEANADIVAKLDHHFKLEEPYIRHLTLRFEGEIPPEEEAPAATPEAKTEEKKEESAEGDKGEEKAAEEVKTEAVEEAKPEETAGEESEKVEEEKKEAAPAEETPAKEASADKIPSEDEIL